MLETIFEGMVRHFLEGMFNMMDPLVTDDIAFGSFQDNMGALLVFIRAVHHSATGPIGYSILGFCVLLALYDKLAGNAELKAGDKSIETIILTLIMFVALKVIIDKACDMLLIFDGLTDFARVRIFQTEFSIHSWESKQSVDQLMEMMREGGGAYINFIPIILIGWLAALIAFLVAKVVLLSRFLEMAIYLAFAPIPLAMLAHEQTREFGKGYIINFASVSLQAAVMMFLMKAYPYIMGSILFQGVSGTQNMATAANQVTSFMMEPIIYSVVFIMAVLGISALTRRVLGRG